jgi:hypothetical protein
VRLSSIAFSTKSLANCNGQQPPCESVIQKLRKGGGSVDCVVSASLFQWLENNMKRKNEDENEE